MNRKHFLDNIRWVTVLLVLLYHVVYFYNNKASLPGGRHQQPLCPTEIHKRPMA